MAGSGGAQNQWVLAKGLQTLQPSVQDFDGDICAFLAASEVVATGSGLAGAFPTLRRSSASCLPAFVHLQAI
jgi:hypothetical protein